MQLTAEPDDNNHLGLIIGLSVGIFVALVFIVGEFVLNFNVMSYKL